MTIERKDLTSGEAAGTGLYDDLMRTSKSHLEGEFKAGTITGTDYAQVYLGVIQANLQVALQFVLQQEMTNKQLKVMDEQILQAKKQNELLDLQKAQLTISNATAQYNLDEMLPQQLLLLKEQTARETAQKEVAVAQKAQVTAQTSLVAKQELLVDENIKAAIFETSNPSAGNGMAYVRYTKGQAEVALLNQKKLTEDKQINGTKDDTGGLVGSEMELKYIQKESFIRDSEQKASKMMSDIYATLYATDPTSAVTPATYGFTGDNTKEAFDKLFAGINATYTK